MTTVDLAAARAFLDTHARILDRRRHALLDGHGDAAGVLAALEAYGNPDGGYGWGLEPDLRAPESQPAAVSSLQITAFTTAAAHEVAAHDPAVAGHPWLERATAYCLDAIAGLDEQPFAYTLAFAIRLLDILQVRGAEAPALMRRLATHVPADGRVPVTGGADGETLHPLDITPDPGRAARALVDPDRVAADLQRLAGGQREDGGWTVDYLPISPAGSLEWRGCATVKAVKTLRRNGVLAAGSA